MGRYINGIYYPDPGEDPNNPSYPTGSSGTNQPFPGATSAWNWLNRPATTQIELTPEEQSARSAMQTTASQPSGGFSLWDYLPSWAGGTAAPAVTSAPSPESTANWYITSGMNPMYGPGVTEADRMSILSQLGKPQSEGGLGIKYLGGQGPTAAYQVGDVRMSEGELLNQYMTKGIKASPTGTSSIPAYIYQAQAANYQASADLARAQMADIPLAREQATQTFIASEAARKFGQQAQIIGLQTQNRELALRGQGIAFDQSYVAAQAANRIAELDLQQKNLQSQYEFNTSAANAAATNAANQFNAQMGFNVEQANVAARQRRQEQLQSLARDVAEAAKSPGDYGKLAALTLANAGWGAENTAIGRGEDIRTEQSLAPTESLLRTRRDVLAEPTTPFSYTPIAPSLVTAPMVPTVDRRNFVIPQPTVTPATVQKEKLAGDVSLLGLPGQWNQNSAVNALQSGASSADVNAALNAAIAAQTAPAPAPAAPAAAAEGGVVPRYEDGGVNMQNPMQAYQSGGANALYNALRSAGSSEQQAADFVNTVVRSDAALQQNTAAAQQAQAMQQPISIEQAANQIPQSLYRYSGRPSSNEDTEAQLLRLGMSNPYMGGGYGTGGTYGQEDAMPAAAGWTPQMPQQFTNYSNEVDSAPAVAGWTPKVPDAFMQRKAQFDSDFSALKSNQISGDEFEKRNKDLDENQFLQFTRLYGIPAAGSAALAAGAAVPTFMKWLMKGNQYRYNPAVDYNILNSAVPQSAPFERGIDPNIMRSMGLGETLEDAQRLGLYATGGVANGAYISGERGPELNIPLGDKTIILNQKQMKAAGIDLKKLMSDSVKPKGFADGGVFDQGWGNVTDPDRTLSMNFLNDALARARAGTPWQSGPLPTPVYASTPGFSPLVMQTLGSLTSMAQGIPTEYFQELAAKYRPSGVRESVTQRTA